MILFRVSFISVAATTAAAAVGYFFYSRPNKQPYVVDHCLSSYKPLPMLCDDKINEYGGGYARLPDDLIKYIKSTNKSVLEVCAGNGSVAEGLRSNDILVNAFDVFSNKFVKYGPSGSVEHLYPDSILMVLNGINVERSIEAFQGNIIILGGYGNWCNIKVETIEIMNDPAKPVVTTIENHEISQWNESSLINVKIRPSSKYMSDVRYILDKVFFAKLNDDSRWESTFYLFQVWIKNAS